MKTTLDGVVFLLPHVSGHAKTEFHRRRIFPGPRGGRGNGMRRSGESAGGGVASGGRQGSGRQGDRAAGGKAAGRQGSGRQGGRAARRRAARRQSGRTAKWQDGKVAGRQKKRGLRFFLKKIKNHFVRKSYVPASRRQGRVIAADKSGAPPAPPPKKTGETIMSRPF